LSPRNNQRLPWHATDSSREREPGRSQTIQIGSIRAPARVAVTAALVALSSVLGCFRGSAPTAGFWFEDASFSLPGDAATKLGGPLQPEEIELIERVSRAEIERAFSALRIAIIPNRDAFWRVEVLRSLPRRGPLPRAGESLALGSLGGAGAVDFTFVAVLALRYAPLSASRQTILEGVARGVGRVAVHEFAHQILGAAAGVHDRNDANSYEYPSPDRASQYYGELHWTIAWPLLEKRLGSRRD
jgi:hypothetical protein